jgi:hypothetical protein
MDVAEASEHADMMGILYLAYLDQLIRKSGVKQLGADTILRTPVASETKSNADKGRLRSTSYKMKLMFSNPQVIKNARITTRNLDSEGAGVPFACTFEESYQPVDSEFSLNETIEEPGERSILVKPRPRAFRNQVDTPESPTPDVLPQSYDNGHIACRMSVRIVLKEGTCFGAAVTAPATEVEQPIYSVSLAEKRMGSGELFVSYEDDHCMVLNWVIPLKIVSSQGKDTPGVRAEASIPAGGVLVGASFLNWQKQVSS